MGPVPPFIARLFKPDRHVVEMLVEHGPWLDLHDQAGNVLTGIRGIAGARGQMIVGDEIGVDIIEMMPGSGFPPHVHPGDHILFGLAGEGSVSVNGIAYPIRRGTSVFIAAEQPHAVLGPVDERFVLLAFGVPHEHLSSTKRMRLVDPDAAGAGHDRTRPMKVPPSS